MIVKSKTDQVVYFVGKLSPPGGVTLCTTWDPIQFYSRSEPITPQNILLFLFSYFNVFKTFW